MKKVGFPKQTCIVCGQLSINGTTHAKCLKTLDLHGAISIWKYEKVIRKAIIKLKYNFASEIAKETSLYASECLKSGTSVLPKEAILIPIPLHRSRLNWRGFNQSAEIGKGLAKEMGWDYMDNVVIRKVKTKPQTELRGIERKKNLKEAFSFNESFNSLTNSKRKLILFDDVWTTGATLKEMCKVLKKNGVKEVWAITIAK
jgi:ComF family protein